MRTGLLGASAAMAMGAVAVASGLIPGPGSLGSPQGGDRVQADGPTDLDSPPLPSAAPSKRASDGAANRADARDDAPAPAPSEETERPSKAPSTSPSPSREPEKTPEREHRQSPSPQRTDADRSPGTGAGTGEQENSEENEGGAAASTTPDPETAAEREVLALVNQERAKAGCKPVRADSDLADLASSFSEEMAERGFFDHTSPDGNSPWDRAEAMGIDDLGGENIARGQANARSVMDSWMNSPGHKANILNCDYRTLGVGAHFAEGGPWWTQDFGF